MRKNEYKIKFRIPRSIRCMMLEDLRRPHPWSFERVGFLFTKSKLLNSQTLLIIAIEYVPVGDTDYIEDESVGARISSNAIRQAMQGSLNKKSGCFHVHLHDHRGIPKPSFTDIEGLPGVVRSLSNVASRQANGILILSKNAFFSKVQFNDVFYNNTAEISIVGYSMEFHFTSKKNETNKVYDRQSFLGENAQFLFENITVGIVGYGGGGSHIGQQLAHLGVKNIFVFDNDKIEDTNLNRLIGAWFSDIKRNLLKTEIAQRTLKKIFPNVCTMKIPFKWQERAELLDMCDIVFGNVDSYLERYQLESECRKFMIPLIDIGMDVNKLPSNSFAMSGQVILSMPEGPCLECYGFITKEKLAIEAQKYGDSGGRPQVVWPNGVLASSAVGIFVDLITGWTNRFNEKVYLEYNGVSGGLKEHVRNQFASEICNHYPISEAGPTSFTKI